MSISKTMVVRVDLYPTFIKIKVFKISQYSNPFSTGNLFLLSVSGRCFTNGSYFIHFFPKLNQKWRTWQYNMTVWMKWVGLLHNSRFYCSTCAPCPHFYCEAMDHSFSQSQGPNHLISMADCWLQFFFVSYI